MIPLLEELNESKYYFQSVEVEELLADSQDVEMRENLEQRLEEADLQITQLREQLKDNETWKAKLEKESE